MSRVVRVITERNGGESGFGRWASWWVPPALYAAAIFVVSSSSHPPSPPSLVTDKHVHLVVFAGLALLLWRALSHGWQQLWRARPALMAIGLTALYGASDEWHQSFVPGRHAEVADLMVDVLGATLAVGLVWLIAAWRHRHAALRGGVGLSAGAGGIP